MSVAAPSAPPLASVVGSRRWLKRNDPFPHIVVRDVFTNEFHSELEAAWAKILEPGLDAPGQRLSHMGWYDSYGLSFSQDETLPFRIFVSRPWHDLLARAAGVRATGHVNAGIHHHATGSAHGFVHNDLNPAWFAETESSEGIHVARQELVSYTTGEILHPGSTRVRYVRSLAVLYFLGNAPWSPGDGGELGLYRYHDDRPGSPEVAVPPLNNSLVIFECTPYSFHGFISNRANPRTSVIAWLHQSERDVAERWGLDALVPFARREGRGHAH